jgi:hypothetical protein
MPEKGDSESEKFRENFCGITQYDYVIRYQTDGIDYFWYVLHVLNIFWCVNNCNYYVSSAVYADSRFRRFFHPSDVRKMDHSKMTRATPAVLIRIHHPTRTQTKPKEETMRE